MIRANAHRSLHNGMGGQPPSTDLVTNTSDWICLQEHISFLSRLYVTNCCKMFRAKAPVQGGECETIPQPSQSLHEPLNP